MTLTTRDIIKLQLDYFFNRPELLAEGLMFADEETLRGIAEEAKKRGVDLAPYIAKEFNRQFTLGQKL